MTIPTEPIGSVPRPLALHQAISRQDSLNPQLEALYDDVALAGEPDRTRVLKIIRQYIKPGHRIFIGVVSPIDPRMEHPKEIRDRILEAVRYIPVDEVGTTDDCGFSPFLRRHFDHR